MTTRDLEDRWIAYKDAEKLGLRRQALNLLDEVIEMAKNLPAEQCRSWVEELACQIVDQDLDQPVRAPLFKNLILPVLREGLNLGRAGCARWLADLGKPYPRVLSSHLPREFQTPRDLLRQALRLDPDDARACQLLIAEELEGIAYSLHELPSAVLCGPNAATVEECDEMLEDLHEFEKLVTEHGVREQHKALIEKAGFHYRLYKLHLQEPTGLSFPERLLETPHKPRPV